MEIDNPLTPQPGDVWATPAGLVYCISHFVGPVLIPMGSGNTSYGARVGSIHVPTSGMTYLGRASDLIGEALARREEPQTPDESLAEAIESFARKLLHEVGADKRLRVEIADPNHIAFDARPYSIPREYIAEIEEFAGRRNYSVTITAGEIVG